MSSLVHQVRVGGRGYRSVILDEANYGGLPLAAWMFDEVNGTTATDLMGLANATYVNGPTLGFTPGPISRSSAGAASFTNPDHAVIANVVGTALDNPDTLCIETWIRWNGGGGSQYVVSRDTSSYGYSLRISGGQVALKHYGGSLGSVQEQTTAAVLTANQWHHVAAVHDSGGLTIYVDGESKALGAVGIGLNTGNRLIIGATATGGTPTAHFGGQLYGTLIYDYAPAADRIGFHYLAGLNGN